MKVNGITFLLFIFISLLFHVAQSQPIYSVPWATQQPKFVFPVFLEEASGMRDTVYFCYDPNAHFAPVDADSIFGSKFIFVDTNSFYAYFESSDFCGTFPQQCEYQIKASVSLIDTASLSPQFPHNWYRVGFKNGYFPVKISWDISALYSDSLPFPFTNGLPHAQGRFTPYPGSPYITLSENGNIMNANLLSNLLVSDTNYVFKDSCTISSIQGTGPFSVEACSFGLYFEKWTGMSNQVKDLTETSIKIYPNPVSDIMNIELLKNEKHSFIQLYNLTGQEVYRHSLEENNLHFNVSLENLNDGYYILKYISDHYSFSKKIIISHK